MIKIFIRGKIETDQVYKINKLLIYYLLKENINLDMRLKISTISDCPYITDFISQKAEFNIYLLLLSADNNLFIKL